MAAGTPV